MRLLLLLSSALGFTLRAPGRSATARAASAAPPESGAEARLLALVDTALKVVGFAPHACARRPSESQWSCAEQRRRLF